MTAPTPEAVEAAMRYSGRTANIYGDHDSGEAADTLHKLFRDSYDSLDLLAARILAAEVRRLREEGKADVAVCGECGARLQNAL